MEFPHVMLRLFASAVPHDAAALLVDLQHQPRGRDRNLSLRDRQKDTDEDLARKKARLSKVAHIDRLQPHPHRTPTQSSEVFHQRLSIFWPCSHGGGMQAGPLLSF